MSKGPKGKVTGGIPKFNQIDKKVLRRLLSYIFKDYTWQFVLVIGCIIFSSLARVSSSLLLEILIDGSIDPMIGV